MSMNKKQLQNLFEELMNIFHGIMDGTISYSLDSQSIVMGTNVCEVFDSVAGDVIMKINGGHPESVVK